MSSFFIALAFWAFIGPKKMEGKKKAAAEMQGTGMGLAIVNEIAALHGGESW